jgi:uncharacterized membrane protein YeiH
VTLPAIWAAATGASGRRLYDVLLQHDPVAWVISASPPWDKNANAGQDGRH